MQGTRVFDLERETLNFSRQRQMINLLMHEWGERLYYSSSLTIAWLCLRWKKYDHPQKIEAMARLIEIGSTQAWFQNPYNIRIIHSAICDLEDESNYTA